MDSILNCYTYVCIIIYIHVYKFIERTQCFRRASPITAHDTCKLWRNSNEYKLIIRAKKKEDINNLVNFENH